MLEYFNEDCFKTMKNLKNIDAIVTDIPYGIGFHGDKDPDTDWDKFENEEYILFLEKFFKETYLVSKNNAIMFIFIAPTKMKDVIFCKKDWIFRPEYTFYYCRAKGRGAKNKLKSLREDIFCFTKEKDRKLNFNEINELEKYRKKIKKPIGYSLNIENGERTPQYSLLDRSFFITSPAYNNVAEKQIHSCQKPLLLFTELIMLSSLKGETVLDPFMGSGASGVASYLCDRKYIGIEKEKDMYEKALKWREDAEGNTRVHEHLNEYIKKRVSSSEKGFRFGWDSRLIMPKN